MLPAPAIAGAASGPAQVQVIAAENAALSSKPDLVLAISERIPQQSLARVEPAQQLRHRLDVASAHSMKRNWDGFTDIMQGLCHTAPEWLASQQYARDILEELLDRRRGPWTQELRDIAETTRLPV